jgi:hypothetical protein
MTDDTVMATEPLWLAMERKIRELSDSDFEGNNKEGTIQRIASALDEAGHNVSRHGGNMLQLRWAIDARVKVGSPLLTDFDAAVAALTLEDLADTRVAALALARKVGETWPKIKGFDRRADIVRIVEDKKLDLLVTKAKGMADDHGIRFLIAQEISPATVVETLGITEARYGEVSAAVEAERAEKVRVEGLLKEVADRTAEEKARHLINNDVSDDSIVQLAGIDEATIGSARKAMAAELEEKRRLAEEAAAAKKAAAEGPALDAIPADEMLEHIESIREIMEFSDVEKEIRTMCEQSDIPKSLVDVAVSDPDKLDELEKAAEG